MLQNFACQLWAPLLHSLPLSQSPPNKQIHQKRPNYSTSPFPPQFSCSGLLRPLLSGHLLPRLPPSRRKPSPGPNLADSSGKAAQAESSEIHSPLDPRPSVTSAPQRVSAPAARTPREARRLAATVTNFPRGGSCTQGFCPPPPAATSILSLGWVNPPIVDCPPPPGCPWRVRVMD